MAEYDAVHLAAIGSRCSPPSRVALASLGAIAPLTAAALRDLSVRYQMDGSD